MAGRALRPASASAGISHEGLDLGSLKLAKLPGIHVGDRLAEPPLANDAGEKVKLSDHQEKVILLDLWASWCGACLKQSPQVQKLAKRWKEEDRCYILGVNLDEDRDAATAAMRNHHLDWPQAFVEPEHYQRAMSTMGCTSLPAYLVIDAQGILRYRGPNLVTAQTTLDQQLGRDRGEQRK